VVKRDVSEVAPHRAERVHVRLALFPPVDELDSQLERSLRVSQEIVFVEPDHPVEGGDRGDRRLAHADDADLGGLDQRDGQSRPHDARQRRRGHPAGGAAARDDHRPYFLPPHEPSMSGILCTKKDTRRHAADGCRFFFRS
jgi:hypothetical protein